MMNNNSNTDSSNTPPRTYNAFDGDVCGTQYEAIPQDILETTTARMLMASNLSAKTILAQCGGGGLTCGFVEDDSAEFNATAAGGYAEPSFSNAARVATSMSHSELSNEIVRLGGVTLRGQCTHEERHEFYALQAELDKRMQGQV